MGMIFAAEYMQLAIHATAEWTLGQHALDRELNRALRVLFQQFAQRDAFQVAHIAGVLVVELVGELGAGNAYVAGIDDDDMVAQVLMGRIGGLMLALQAMRNLGGQTAQGLARGIDEEPVPARLFRLGKYGIHGNLLGRWRKAREFTEAQPQKPVPFPAAFRGIL